MTSTDSRVNPYRYGVLEGNHVEDRFSLDLINKQVFFSLTCRNVILYLQVR